MASCVHLFGADSGSALIDLASAMAIGIVAYPAFLLGLWWACGRPDGGEREALLFAQELRDKWLASRRAAAGEA
jgi:hypothetical protein